MLVDLLVDLLGVTAWAVNDPEDPDRHWPDYPERSVGHWPLDPWVTAENMCTACGEEHRGPRRLVSPAFGTRRGNAPLPGVDRITAELPEAIAAVPRPTGRARRPAGTPGLSAPGARVTSDLMGPPPDPAVDFRRTVYAIFDATP